jgi:hypothetical protein
MSEAEAAAEAGSVEAIARSLSERGPARTAMYGVERLGAGALAVVDKEVAGIVRQLMEYDLGDLLVQGWKTYSRLMDAAKRSVRKPERKENVAFASHTVKWAWQPKVDVLVDGAVVNTLEFVFSVDVELEPVVLVVRDGHLESISAGSCTVATTLTLEGGTILPEHKVPIDNLAVLLRLRKPIRLLGTDAG